MPVWLVMLSSVVGCTRPIAVRGLRPEYPEALWDSFSNKGHFVEVDSLRPTLRWEPFPRPQDRQADNEGLLKRIRNVTYDLKIWRAYEEGPIEYPAEVAYSRRGLQGPSHQVEEPLESATKYFWTVRARFELDDQPRVTEWGVTGVRVVPFSAVARLPVVPNPLHYRFKTPSK